ncbi:TetR/AcrR family transcriptional regulator [Jongsikchunia kroppenstedtii]|uniref:TetR/AcrR family transcriptional regulator n=1 Tax=Jongsikchunia kroppenstedtii TaxID=1121721 RepID=UPI000372EF6E|nr:TetR/AcrR family transcriptional regulator [Jongsikchunia kroppenstedtii]
MSEAAEQPTTPELLFGRSACERADAARNREALLQAARKLITRDGVEDLSMDTLAREAGVGKGTVFRRFGSRAGLMLALLDHDEQEFQQGFITGPPPLGPGAPARDRLLAFGRARLNFVQTHVDVLSSADSEGAGFGHPAYQASAMHVRMLLQQLGFDRPNELLVLSVLAPLQAHAVQHLLSGGASLTHLADQWDQLVDSLRPPPAD